MYDFIIIGSGPAGSVLAWNLAKKNYKIAIIDRATNTKIKSSKNDFIFSPYINDCPKNYSPLFSNQLGGNSALWNNKIYLMSEPEFNEGDWPFSYQELLKYSKDIAKKFDIDHEKINKIKNEDNNFFSISSREKKIGNIFNYLEIAENKNINVYDNSSPTNIFFDDTKKKIKSLSIRNILSKKDTIINLKNALIFCAGGLGNPNLIHNLVKDSPKNIGKNLCDHPHINILNLGKRELQKKIKFAKYFINNPSSKLEQNLFIQEKSYFAGAQIDLFADPSIILKRIYLRTRTIFSKKILNFLIKKFNLFISIIYKILSILGVKDKYSYEFFFSQALNPENLIVLDDKAKDKFGLFKANIYWKLSNADKENYQKIVKKFTEENRLNFKKKYLFNDNKFFVGLHPSCSTAALKDTKNSCVDKNLKILGIDNLYVCGSSVFSNNGFTNPTWTIFFFFYRLSYYLDDKFK